MSTPKLYPLNDLAFLVTLKKINTTTGKSEPLTSGTVTAFLATSNTPTATAADASLSVTAVHVGSGKWLVNFDASALTASLLATHFAAATPYMIVQASGDVRTYVELAYVASRPATVS